MKIFQGLFIMAMFILTGCDEIGSLSEPLVEVKADETGLVIEILDNGIQIQDIVVNRGNCDARLIVNTEELQKEIQKTVNPFALALGNYGAFETTCPWSGCFQSFFGHDMSKDQVDAFIQSYESLTPDEKEKYKRHYDAFLASNKEMDKKYSFGDEVLVGLYPKGTASKFYQEMATYGIKERKIDVAKNMISSAFSGDREGIPKLQGLGGGCNVKEVKIKTNRGTWDFGFDRQQ